MLGVVSASCGASSSCAKQQLCTVQRHATTINLKWCDKQLTTHHVEKYQCEVSNNPFLYVLCNEEVLFSVNFYYNSLRGMCSSHLHLLSPTPTTLSLLSSLTNSSLTPVISHTSQIS
jgi:hypothetical protein